MIRDSFAPKFHDGSFLILHLISVLVRCRRPDVTEVPPCIGGLDPPRIDWCQRAHFNNLMAAAVTEAVNEGKM